MLRGLAILLVITWHYPKVGAPEAFLTLSRVGWTGVELFFVLSGFLIGGQLLEPVARSETPSLSRFYLRRAFRILPSFWVVLAVYLFLPSLRERALETPAWRFLTFTQNFGLHFNAFSHAWSLCVEEHFYLALPLLVLMLRRARASSVVVGAVLLMVLGAGVRSALWQHFFANLDESSPAWRDYDTLLYYPTYARLDGLTCGVLLALARVYRPAWWARVTGTPWIPGALGLALLALAAWVGEVRVSWVSTVFSFPLYSLGYACVLVAMASPAASRVLGRVPGLPLFATLAFTVYLTHKMVIHAVHDALAPHGLGAYDVVTVLACAPAILATAWLLHRGVERPMLRMRESFERAIGRARMPSLGTPTS
ncbi:acyltransferase [Corallococcus sp. H22C18031201]|uniref:acyltransferase family protein n=1 Tax=Citreicoccus inhibens TaxID=2849499 RepID=UPI000E762C15|nr:acyltransferase [Citreicoccus inhibens]MBU8897846.1 acyltransferase [Citreicoccus inhibens]RJS24890.1 acyltransferase [Corallococcus sp. H22C18031201]